MKGFQVERGAYGPSPRSQPRWVPIVALRWHLPKGHELVEALIERGAARECPGHAYDPLGALWVDGLKWPTMPT